MVGKRKRVFRVEFNPEDVAQLSDLQIRQLLSKALASTVLGAYEPKIVKQATRRPTPKDAQHGLTNQPSANESVFRNADANIKPREPGGV